MADESIDAPGQIDYFDDYESIESYHCDWHGVCRRRPWVEIHPVRIIKRGKEVEHIGGWSYLCRRHFWLAQVRRVLSFWSDRSFGWCYACWHPPGEECHCGGSFEANRAHQPPVEAT
jgi:hypothetical protein